MDMFKENLRNLIEDLALIKRALASAPNNIEPARVRVLEPKHYGGARCATEFENFHSNMKHYFQGAHAREEDSVNGLRPLITSWKDLETELKEQFLLFYGF
ncbi:hypothetical protein AMTR_s00159p00066740 [Amborella trichopoda]|uniref:Uncharacterized protein n=1 Tax=Amborella trichopoda TaxID=13333 RepID=W1PQ15_AMBTC|nr:hypothetical protein AMTR_s00159p00066740 [Amborella trichopoda]